MAKKNSKKLIKEVVEGTVCANECTGALQKIYVDPEEVEKLNAEYNKKSK